MTTDEIMALVCGYADAASTHRLESLYGTSKSYTLVKARERDKAQQNLRTAIKALVADAERYRWLRSQWFTMGASYPDNTVQFHIGATRWSEQPESNIDDAIDAARSKT